MLHVVYMAGLAGGGGSGQRSVTCGLYDIVWITLYKCELRAAIYRGLPCSGINPPVARADARLMLTMTTICYTQTGTCHVAYVADW